MKGTTTAGGKRPRPGNPPAASAGRKPAASQRPRAKRPGTALPAREPAAPGGHLEPRLPPDDAGLPAAGLRRTVDWRESVATTVAALGYELVDAERAGRGLLRVTIDRVAGAAYPHPGDSVLVEDCEAVTRQLQYALEVDAVDYARLEVSSPGLDRPLRRAADYERFCGQAVHLTLKQPLAGRRRFEGRLERAAAPEAPAGSWQLVFRDGAADKALSFTLDEVHDAHLVPVIDFKGRRGAGASAPQGDAVPSSEGGVG